MYNKSVVSRILVSYRKESGYGHVKPVGMLRPQVLKRETILGERLPGGALTDSHRQVSASVSDRLRMMEQHGCTLPPPMIISIIFIIVLHICS